MTSTITDSEGETHFNSYIGEPYQLNNTEVRELETIADYLIEFNSNKDTGEERLKALQSRGINSSTIEDILLGRKPLCLLEQRKSQEAERILFKAYVSLRKKEEPYREANNFNAFLPSKTDSLYRVLDPSKHYGCFTPADNLNQFYDDLDDAMSEVGFDKEKWDVMRSKINYRPLSATTISKVLCYFEVLSKERLIEMEESWEKSNSETSIRRWAREDNSPERVIQCRLKDAQNRHYEELLYRANYTPMNLQNYLMAKLAIETGKMQSTVFVRMIEKGYDAGRMHQ